MDASTKDVLRQTTIDATPLYTPVARSLTFPSYDVSEGQRLLLQLEVAALERRPVRYGLAHAQPEHSNLALNGVPDAGSGPLAFVHQVTSSGLRGALHGQPEARVQLILALALTGLTALANPPRGGALGGLRRAGTAGKRLTRQAAVWRRRLGWLNREAYAGSPQTGRVRVLAMPWYPWLAALIPVLHFLAVNPLHFTVREALVPATGILLVVTLAMASLRLILRDWHRAAAAVTAVTVAVFAYEHVKQALDARLDDQVLFPAATILAAAAIGTAVRNRDFVFYTVPILNITSGILLLFQIITIAETSFSSSARTPRLSPRPLQTSTLSSNRPDIYYIVLDAYGRHDTLSGFDNSNFLRQLEQRGFFIAKEATSNYTNTIDSLASTLNLNYLKHLGSRVPKTKSDGINLVQQNTLTATLKSLGYTFVHLESGYIATSCAPQADIILTFTPSGVIESQAEDDTDYSSCIRSAQDAGKLSFGFLRSLLGTTALRPVIGHRISPPTNTPYDYWSPERTLQMFEVLSEPIYASGPKFIFAHIVKPHQPATFDRHGNMLISHRVNHGFSDIHDPTVPNAYIGQLVFINSLVLRMVDSILENHVEKPVIVIAGDHAAAAHGEHDVHAILAAFHLPDGGNSVLYSSISSVNHFRSILDFYFGFNLGLLDDLMFAGHGD